ncbi:MAG TPA: alcohol dehydrogenase [bacterium]|nr:alcohol dehydrogenase [bacterium]HEX68585.1 alcohol dehydrogenase [bacterium]
MKVAVLYGKEKIRIEEREKPKPGKGEVLVKVKTALTCGTDVKVFLKGGHPRMIKLPSPFGHEFSGEIAEVGEGVEGWEKGMRVVAVNSAPCFQCYHCRRGEYSLCEDLLFLNGAYAEYILIPERIVRYNLYSLPSNLSFEESAFLEPLSCVVHGVEEIGVKLGDTVVVLGSGPIGLLFLLLLKIKGARVIVVDKVEDRLRTAKNLGAETFHAEDREKILLSTPEGRGADVVVEAVGLPETWEETLSYVRKGGRILLFGGCTPGTTFTLDTARIHYGEVTVKGVFHHTPYHVVKALKLLTDKIISVKPLITHHMSLEELPQALEMVKEKKALKIAIHP